MTDIPVCIFAKPPIPGRAKTRIARFIGDDAAARLASAMLCDVWSAVQTVAELIPVLAAAEPGSFPIDIPEERIWLQGPGDLGCRIESILRRGLQDAPAAIALGADTPLVTAACLQEAVTCLRSHDAVVGPCLDGGFYLLGVRHCPSGLLSGLPWSSEITCNETEQRVRANGMSVGTIERLPDVDTVSDLDNLREQLKLVSGGIALHTRRWISETSW